jgi:hypothetical protein
MSEISNHRFIDLGLSVLWSASNLRATSSRERGVFHALALPNEIANMGIPPQNQHGQQVQELAWRKPTREEFEELFLCCDLFWGEYLGVTGLTAVSRVYPNKYIFFPSTGWRDLDGSIHDEDICYYWTGEPYKYDNHFAWGFQFDEKQKQCIYKYTGYGYCIRPVLERNNINNE